MRLHESGRTVQSEKGIALIVALMASMLLTAAGLAVVLVTNTETMITSNYRTNFEGVYAADAGVERAVQDLLLVPDWNRIWSANLKSSFVDDTSCTGSVTIAGSSLSLTQLTTQLQTDTNTRNFWGANDPVWAPYACGWVRDLVPGQTVDTGTFVMVWTGDDPTEIDGNPLRDDNGTIMLHAEALGEAGLRKVIEVTARRTDVTEIERGQIAQRGQEELNQRARKAAVQTPGRSLTRMNMLVAEGTMR